MRRYRVLIFNSHVVKRSVATWLARSVAESRERGVARGTAEEGESGGCGKSKLEGKGEYTIWKKYF